MSKLPYVVVAALLACASVPALAMDDMKMDMKAMDTNGDGMISKKEFMKYHETMYNKMKKGSNGMVSMKDMDMMHMQDGMMKDGKPMKGDAMMKDGKAMKGDAMMKDGAMLKDGTMMKDGTTMKDKSLK